jgi:hypothetical protein
MSYRHRRKLLNKKEVVVKEEPKPIYMEEEKLIEPIVIIEEVKEEVVEEVKEELVVEEVVEEKKEEKELPDYSVEEFVEIDGKKVSKFDIEPVICLNTGVIYDNNKIAMQETGVNSGAIKRNCRGFTKCAGKDENGKKLVWRFAKDV